MMKKPRCGVKDKFEFEENGQTLGMNTCKGIHSKDNDSASDCNCLVLVKISARTLLPSVRHCMIFLSSSRIVPYMANFTFAKPCIVMHICEKDQQDAHFFLNNLFQLNYPGHVSNK
jgi:hypothetical protein